MDDQFRRAAETLVARAGLSADAIALRPLPGGRNNRVYRVDSDGGTALLKQYFRGGDWDRLAAESRFLRFCADGGVDRVPRLLGEDPASGLALHAWLEGVPSDPDGLTDNDADEAAAFLGQLVAAAERLGGDELAAFPRARDACLCLEDFFRSPRERIALLEKALSEKSPAPFTDEALSFFQNRLKPAWEKAERIVAASLAGEDLARAFPNSRLFVSPSDFGFHNALKVPGGGLRFVDFEYAGLDSLVKAIGDFVCQVDYPAPPDMADRLAAACGAGDELAEMVGLLLPLFRIKFCCIILNDFKGADARRRRFSQDGKHMRLRDQLAKAETYLDRWE